MKETTRHAVIATLAYAHIFDYPLTEKEIYEWMITNTYKRDFALSKLQTSIQCYKGYYGLFQIKKNVRKREERMRFSEEKMIKARQIALVLRFIPTIFLIGVSGGLAMKNADEEDDIDMFFVVAPNTIWITRLLILGILQILGKRRKFGDIFVKNLICVNMIVDLNHLALPLNERDLYSAHEVLQMIPLFDRGNTYQRFLSCNSWVKNYLYHAWNWKIDKVNRDKKINAKCCNVFMLRLFWVIFRFLDVPAEKIQLFYMKRKITTEKIAKGILRFHPHDARIYIQKRFLLLLRKWNIPCNGYFHIE